MKSIKENPNYLLIIVFGFILIVSPLLRFSWDFGTQTLLHIVIISSFLFLINSRRLPFSFSQEGLLLLFLVIVIISSKNAVEFASFRNDFLMLCSSLIFAYMFNHLSINTRKLLLHIPVFIAFWFAIILMAYFIYNPFRFIFSAPLYPEFIVNLNIVAGYLTLCLPISFAIWKKNNKQYIILSLLIFIGIILTKSRAAILTALLTSGIFIWNFHHSLRRWLKLFFLCGGIALVFFTIVKLKIYSVSSNYFLSDRFVWWQTAWEMFKKNILFGIGWGNFGNNYQVYRTSFGLNTIYAHNIFLQILSEAGLLGISSFIFAIYTSLISIKKQIQQNQDTSFYVPILLATVGFLAINLLDYSFYVPALMILFWLCLTAGFSKNLASREKSLIPNWITGIIVLCFVFLVSRLFISSVYYQYGAITVKKDPAKAEEYLLKSIKTDPFPSLTYSALAEAYFISYSKSGKQTYLKKAIDTELEAIRRFKSNAAYWSDLAWLYKTNDDNTKAFKAMCNAIKYDRFNRRYQKALKRHLTVRDGEAKPHCPGR